MGNNPQKQNIFAAQPGQGDNPNDVASGGQEGAKTSTEGELGGGAPGGPAASTSAPKVQESGIQQQNKNTSAAYKANVGKTAAPSTLKDIETRIGTAQSGLEKQASDYAAQQAASHNYALDKSVAEKAVKEQDQAAKSDVLGLLGRGMAEPIADFKPQGVDVKDVDLLKTPAGIKNLVARGRSPTYSTNMAAFDSMLLQADPNFQRQVSGIKQQAGNLQRSVADTRTKAQADAEAAAQANLSKSQQDIRDYLLGFQGNITAEQALAAEQANAALPAQIEAAKAKAAAELREKARLDAQAALGANFGGRANTQLEQTLAGMDPTQFIDFIKGYTPEQFVTQDQANQFNTINQLLGLGGKAQVASGERPDLYTTRADDFKNTLIGKATDARKTQDIINKKQMDDLVAEAQRRANEDNARRLGLTESYGKDVTSMANQMLKDTLKNDAASKAGFYGYSPELQSILDKAVQGYIQSKPASGFKSAANPQIQAQDMYSQSQADQLNALARDLGLPEVYQAGSYAGGGAQSLINKGDLQNLISNAIGSYRGNIQQKQNEAQALKDQQDYFNRIVASLGGRGGSSGSMIPLPDEALGSVLSGANQGIKNPLSTIRNPNPFA